MKEYMHYDEFRKIPGGTELVDANGNTLFKVKPQDMHHTDDCVFDPKDGIVCHYTWFDGLKVKEPKPTTFGDLDCGDMFNTKAARYVKINDEHAIVVQSAVFNIGEIRPILDDYGIIPLYRAKK